jgi:uncharacterized protein (DUF2147 family)
MFVTNRLVAIPPEGATAAMQVRMTMVTQASGSTDQWLGKWTGPEGTFLFLAKNGDNYDINIQSLGGLARYEGPAAGDTRLDAQQGT